MMAFNCNRGIVGEKRLGRESGGMMEAFRQLAPHTGMRDASQAGKQPKPYIWLRDCCQVQGPGCNRYG